MKNLTALLGAVLLALALGPAAAQSPRDAMASVNSSDTMVQSPLPAADFVGQVGAKLRFIIDAGALAQVKGDEDSKAFAKRIVFEQKDLLAELQSLASRAPLRIMITPAAAEQDHNLIVEMRSLNGALFDDLYDPSQVRVHEEMVTLFERYADNGDDAALRRWASRALPKLKRSLAVAVRLK